MLQQILYFETGPIGEDRSELLASNGFQNIWIKRLIKQDPTKPRLKILKGEGSFEKINLRNHPIAFVPAKYLDVVPQLVRFGLTVIGTDCIEGSSNDLCQLFLTLGATATLSPAAFNQFVRHDLLGLYLNVMARRSPVLVIESDLDRGEFLNNILQANDFQTLWLQYIESIDQKVIHGYDFGGSEVRVELANYPLAIIGHHTGYSSGADFIHFLKQYGLASVGIFNTTIEFMDVQSAGSLYAIKPTDFPIFVSEDLLLYVAHEIRREFESQTIFQQ